MQFPRSSSELPSDDVAHTTTRARFPNAVQFAPIFAGRQAPNASPPLDAPFFAEFESSFVEAARRLTAPTAEVLFDGFGFASLDDVAGGFRRSNDVLPETLLLGDDRDARSLFVAPPSTFRLLFDAALGFDVAALCANATLWNDFNADAQTPLTPFEEEAFAQESVRFATLFPTAAFSSSPTVVAFRPTFDRVALELDDALFYWERRVLRLADRYFPWTFVFSTRFLAPLADAALPRDFSEPAPSSFSSTQTPRANVPDSRSSALFSPPFSRRAAEPTESTPFLSDAPGFLDAAVDSVLPSEGDFELAVVVERNEMPTESWRRLKPGDVLTTNVPANALFLGLVNDAPRFLCRPGLYRGAAAVQIKTRADDRE